MAPFQRTVLSADGTQIHVEASGNSSKPAIVFIHGLSCTSLGWDNQFSDPNLLADFYLVRYDMRGHGRSGKPLDSKDYESLRFAEDFTAVCDSFSIERPFLAGWSMGGSVVVDLVAAYGPSVISGVIYIGGGVLSLTKYQPQCTTAFIGDLVPLLLSTDPDDVSRAADLFVDACVATPLPYAEKLQWLGAFLAQPRTVRVHSATRVQPYEVWEEKARGLPVLIVQGTEDRHCEGENMIRLAKSVYEDVEVRMLQGCGHSPAAERGAETSRFIHEWVTRRIGGSKPLRVTEEC
ncbi:alpha/beta-hydrolase [Trametes gibbosa]|nr:alpha/beta-hydrolase [Trametes gibbosa]